MNRRNEEETHQKYGNMTEKFGWRRHSKLLRFLWTKPWRARKKRAMKKSGCCRNKKMVRSWFALTFARLVCVNFICCVPLYKRCILNWLKHGDDVITIFDAKLFFSRPRCVMSLLSFNVPYFVVLLIFLDFFSSYFHIYNHLDEKCASVE